MLHDPTASFLNAVEKGSNGKIILDPRVSKRAGFLFSKQNNTKGNLPWVQQ